MDPGNARRLNGIIAEHITQVINGEFADGCTAECDLLSKETHDTVKVATAFICPLIHTSAHLMGTSEETFWQHYSQALKEKGMM